MCLIIAKYSGLDLPIESRLRTAWMNNSDGFGLAYWEEGMPLVQINKGAMTLRDMLDLVDQVPNAKNKKVIMHFRMATDGRIDAGNCHPFPVSSSIGQLRRTETRTNCAVAHNGIIDDFSTGWTKVVDPTTKKVSWKKPEVPPKLSDTQLFIKEHMVGLGKALFNRSVLSMITAYTDSKFALLGRGKLVLLGKFIQDQGIYYSNDGYKFRYQIDTRYYTWPTDDYGDTAFYRVGGRGWEPCDLCSSHFRDEMLILHEDLMLCPECLNAVSPFRAEYPKEGRQP